MIIKDALAVILGGGKGERLFPLTKYRSKPAVPIGGKFRLIDIPISNCLHWGLRQIYVLTQFNSSSLNNHISSAYKFDGFSKGFLSILAAQQTMEGANWYQGTADAVRKNLFYIKRENVKHVIILSGDQLYRINLWKFMKHHLEKQADITIAVKPVERLEASNFGIMKIDGNQRIVEFEEKPQEEEQLDNLYTPAEFLDLEQENLNYIASMGIYIFNKDSLVELLEKNDKSDFGKQVIPDALAEKKVFAYVFNDYWEDIGTIKSFFEANLDFANPLPKFNFYDEESPIFTRPRFLAGSKIENCDIHYSLISDGSIIEGSKITNSVVGIRSLIRTNSYLERVVMMGSDFYETPAEQEANLSSGRVPVGVGYNCIIRNAILDKNVRIGNHVVINNERSLLYHDDDKYYIRDGIVFIPKGHEIPTGTVI